MEAREGKFMLKRTRGPNLDPVLSPESTATETFLANTKRRHRRTTARGLRLQSSLLGCPLLMIQLQLYSVLAQTLLKGISITHRHEYLGIAMNVIPGTLTLQQTSKP